MQHHFEQFVENGHGYKESTWVIQKLNHEGIVKKIPP